jgi:hypothetical protein
MGRSRRPGHRLNGGQIGQPSDHTGRSCPVAEIHRERSRALANGILMSFGLNALGPERCLRCP